MQGAATVIVPTYNEGEWIRHCIDALIKTGATAEGCEVVVVDDSTDGSTEFLGRPHFRRHVQKWVRNSRRVGAIAARNMGAAKADQSSSLLIFMDANTVAMSGWYGEIMRVHATNPGALLTPAMHGPEDGGSHSPVYGAYVDDALVLTYAGLPAGRSPSGGPWPVAAASGAFVAVPRSAFAAMGGWDEGLRFWSFEDVELSIRAWQLGFPIYTVPGSHVIHRFINERGSHVGWDDFTYNRMRTAMMHFDGRLLQHITEASQRSMGSGDWVAGTMQRAMQQLKSDAGFAGRMRQHRARRVMDGDGYARMFGLFSGGMATSTALVISNRAVSRSGSDTRWRQKYSAYRPQTRFSWR